MVNDLGIWFPEDDYTNYPEKKLCDCDRITIRIREDNYIPKYGERNLVENVIIYFDDPDMDDEYNRMDLNELFRFVEDYGGWKEFDCLV